MYVCVAQTKMKTIITCVPLENGLWFINQTYTTETATIIVLREFTYCNDVNANYINLT